VQTLFLNLPTTGSVDFHAAFYEFPYPDKTASDEEGKAEGEAGRDDGAITAQCNVTPVRPSAPGQPGGGSGTCHGWAVATGETS
jgi:hypothetical protein